MVEIKFVIKTYRIKYFIFDNYKAFKFQYFLFFKTNKMSNIHGFGDTNP